LDAFFANAGISLMRAPHPSPLPFHLAISANENRSAGEREARFR
jgi:hypothetical protein